MTGIITRSGNLRTGKKGGPYEDTGGEDGHVKSRRQASNF